MVVTVPYAEGEESYPYPRKGSLFYWGRGPLACVYIGRSKDLRYIYLLLQEAKRGSKLEIATLSLAVAPHCY